MGVSRGQVKWDVGTRLLQGDWLKLSNQWWARKELANQDTGDGMARFGGGHCGHQFWRCVPIVQSSVFVGGQKEWGVANSTVCLQSGTFDLNILGALGNERGIKNRKRARTFVSSAKTWVGFGAAGGDTSDRGDRPTTKIQL
jgi:hypothetical protein